MMEKNNKLISLHIIEILNKYSDENHKLSQSEIMFYLESEYEERISRKTCSEYLSCLRNNNYISGRRGVFCNAQFSERELKALINGIIYSKSIPENAAKVLINKIKTLSVNSIKNKMRNMHYLPGTNHTENINTFKILDSIDEAIEKDFKVQITPFSISPDGSFHSEAEYIASPYYIVSGQSRYYLLCGYDRNGEVNLEPRRIDRIADITIIPEKRIPFVDIVGHDFDLNKYVKNHMYMFSGTVGVVKLKIDNTAVGSIVDWVGMDYKLIEETARYCIIEIETNFQSLIYWSLQYAEVVEVLEPLFVRNEIKNILSKTMEKYN